MKLIYRFDNFKKLITKGQISDITVGDDFLEIGFSRTPDKYSINILKGNNIQYEVRALENLTIASEILHNPMKGFDLPNKCDSLEINFSNETQDYKLNLTKDDLLTIQEMHSGNEDKELDWVDRIEMFLADLVSLKTDKQISDVLTISKKFDPRAN